MTTHSQAMRSKVHGPIVPMTYKAPRVFRLYRKMQAEEARLARAVDEKPQPAPLVAIALLSAFAVVLFAVLVMGGPVEPSPAADFNPALARATGGDS